MNDIRALSTFVRAAALGSLRKAAIDLGVTPQAASHAVMQLEKSLGVRLFHRTTRKLSLTEEGARLLESAQPALSMLSTALDDARRSTDEIAGPLRVSSARTLGAPVFWPYFIEFAQRYPHVQIDVHFEDRFTDLVSDRADVGFRGGSPPSEGAIARRLLPIQLIVCATPGYLAQHGTPRSIDELTQHRCTGYRRANTGKLAPWEFKIGDETVYRDIPAAICTNETETEVQAVLSGLAIGQLASFSVAEQIRSGQLVPLFLDTIAEHEGIYIYYAHRTQQSLRARTFIDFMIEKLAGNTRFFLTDEDIRAGMARTQRAPAAPKRRSAPRS